MSADERKVSDGLKSALETTTNIAVLVAAVFVAVYFGGLFLRGELPRLSHGPRPGSQLSLLPDYDLGSGEQTLILALQTDCSYCEASLPFYRQLAAAAAQDECGTDLLAVFPEEDEDVAGFVHGNDLRVPTLASVSLPSLGVEGTPTLMLVDTAGTIQSAWVGDLQPADEREILDIFHGPQSVCGASGL